MPTKAGLTPGSADTHPAHGGVAAVDRALRVLAAFDLDVPTLSLSALARRTCLCKSTVLRLLASLEHAHLIVRHSNGDYALGSNVVRLHGAYLASSPLERCVMPALQELVDRTQESAAFYIRQARQRLCLYRIDSPQSLRDHIRIGELLPLERGASGRIFQAYADEGDRILGRRIRDEGVLTLIGDRDAELASIAAPVLGPSAQLAGVLALTMPRERCRPAWAPYVKAAADRVTRHIGGA